ncbi:beta-ketoacyl-ACP reductase [Candidatus Collierbacteria bacterium RIFCSPLOWO2_01_FULL_50_23]|uniref:Beta-ketoacyl-ACP reductase n=2 Tax=Candidatus Collieribacteriota TaxID=1752725 RepID=A0A1F5ETN0_9BACT|nr:MAG: beta-ketoacyl-ACP reductase [Candidatus Collierbacteria bacterium RIFCSPHIGHO2_02_FULL_49_10]OGD71569.1 MAG: beta-ketoacyl-ACP reductase [Candidatus Collierbacteria bacterium RIFCSPHIGHO2_01_FULL_50_25]OGD74372.1 MAG: beta-ketoacyl-ACP reductase [Candidatus Collierbacteria bacterium RIFCSPLOWO2_01_FULL_50_23]
MKFKDKIVLITGSSRGIGRATAIAFAGEGAKVVVNYVKSDTEANSLIGEIEKLGSEAIAIKCDVSEEEQVREMVDGAIKKFGKLDILVNNAALVFDVPLFDKSVEQWHRTLSVNLVGPFLCSKYAAPHLTKEKGKIVNICSNSGLTSFDPTSADYDSSKVGLISLTKDLAIELAPDVLVNAIAPGWVDTDMNADLPKEFIEEEKERALLKRFARPDEIAKVVLFLASNDSSYITGSVLAVDGGYF